MSGATIIPFEPFLPQVLPTIEGNVDYRLLRDQLLRIDELLRLSGLEGLLLRKDLERWLARCNKTSPKAQRQRQLHCLRALRCNIARVLLGENFRDFAARVADSPLLQYFCGLSQVHCITVPSKSTLQRYDQWWPEAEVHQVIEQLVGLAATSPQKLQLAQAVDLHSAFMDSTCLSANIHIGMGFSQHSGMVICCEGSAEAARRIERVLTNDPGTGVMRHADAGYDIAIDCAREKGLDLPSI